MIYKPAKGSRLTQNQAQRYGDRIEALTEENNGIITAKIVLSDAKQDSSPLHDFFTWNDAEAAEELRLGQAAYLLRSIHVVIERDDEQEEARAMYNVKVSMPDAPSASVYVPLVRVLCEEDLRAQVVEAALRELVGWRKRYEQYKEFGAVFEAVDLVQRELGN